MTEYNQEDSITHLNTELNKSMILMGSVVDTPVEKPRRRKSIKINTKEQPPNASSTPVTKSRKSILKKPNKSLTEKSTDDETAKTNNIESISDVAQRLSVPAPVRPRNLGELIETEVLHVEPISSESFNLEDLLENEEIWIMDVPKSINPEELNGQKLQLGNKSKIKIKENRYCAVANNIACNVTCVLNIGEKEPQYQTVNIKPAGFLTIRRKLSEVVKSEPIPLQSSCLPPFPDKLTIRHPLLGINYNNKKIRKKLKKRHSTKGKLK